ALVEVAGEDRLARAIEVQELVQDRTGEEAIDALGQRAGRVREVAQIGGEAVEERHERAVVRARIERGQRRRRVAQRRRRIAAEHARRQARVREQREQRVEPRAELRQLVPRERRVEERRAQLLLAHRRHEREVVLLQTRGVLFVLDEQRGGDQA